MSRKRCSNLLRALVLVVCLGVLPGAARTAESPVVDDADHGYLPPLVALPEAGENPLPDDAWLTDLETLQQGDASALPPIDIPNGIPSSADGLVHPEFLSQLAEAQCLKAVDPDVVDAEACYGRAFSWTFAALTAGAPDSPAQVEAAETLAQSCRGMGVTTFSGAAVGLESFVDEADPSFATWAAHYTLADYYLNEGADSTAADEHLLAVVEQGDLGFVDSEVYGKALDDEAKARLLWIRGYAEYELGMYEDALARFAEIVARFTGGGEYLDRAAFAIPAAQCKLVPEDLETHAAAYAQYLADWPDSPYAPWAMIELGNAYLGLGLLADARATYTEVCRTTWGSEAAESARQRLLAMGVDVQDEDPPSRTKPLNHLVAE